MSPLKLGFIVAALDLTSCTIGFSPHLCRAVYPRKVPLYLQSDPHPLIYFVPIPVSFRIRGLLLSLFAFSNHSAL